MHGSLDPAVLFFVFGALAGAVKSNLEIPPQISRFLSLYLLMSLGLKGGFELAHSGVGGEVAVTLGCAIALAVCLPLVGFQVLKRFVSPYDAAAIAATYGSVSAVTFITATQYLESHQIAYGGHMTAAMALMESPAIVVAVMLANRIRQAASGIVPLPSGAAVQTLGGLTTGSTSIGKLLHESFTDGSQMLLLGALAIGILTGEAGAAVMQPFSGGLFKGMLALFLLDMGLLAARSAGGLKGRSPWVFLYAILGPLSFGAIALTLGALFGVGAGNGALLVVLAASASYIAVPAAVRFAIPEANPSLYLGMSLALTFPFNILFGIPLYISAAQAVLG